MRPERQGRESKKGIFRQKGKDRKKKKKDVHGECIWVSSREKQCGLLEKHRLWSQPWVHISPLALSGCVILVELLNLLVVLPP